MSAWNDSELIQLFQHKTPLIDVRAPIEYQEGFIPFSVNLPIMNNEERAQVGTCYKEEGQARAIELGHSLVRGEVKERRVRGWLEFIQANPEAQLFCFRGGLRSQTACYWLAEQGIQRTPLAGGYKRLRGFFLSGLAEGPLPEMIRVAGPTGTGKTEFLEGFRHIDLEKMANHRGSAFGEMGAQPTQITFENHLALELMQTRGSRILVEDESATIGKITLPQRFFFELRQSPVVILHVDRKIRIENIYHSYVLGRAGEDLARGLERIKKSLGGLNYQTIREHMTEAFSTQDPERHHQWIGLLLDHYYDPLYQRGLTKHAPTILCEGNEAEVSDFLKKWLRPN